MDVFSWGKFGFWQSDAAAAIKKFFVSAMDFIGVVEDRLLANFVGSRAWNSIACGMNLPDLSPSSPCYVTLEPSQKHFRV